MAGAAVTEISLDLLIVCARRTVDRNYGVVAEAAFGKLANVVASTVTLVAMLLGTLIAYQVLVRDV